MISKKLFEKAQNIPVVKIEEGPKSIYIDMIYADRDGRHERTVSCDKNIEPTIENVRDILKCECKICSNFNINHPDFCALKIRAIKELTYRNYWRPEMWNFIVEEVRWYNDLHNRD